MEEIDLSEFDNGLTADDGDAGESPDDSHDVPQGATDVADDDDDEDGDE